jgi:hypothetical protein
MTEPEEIFPPGAEIEPSDHDTIGALIDQTSTELTALLNEAQDLSAELSSDPSTALVAVAGRSPAEVKIQMAEVRATVMKQQQEIVAKQAELKDLLEQKMHEVEEIIAPLTAMVRKLEEGIWTANLYLGRDEEIIQIRDGEPAPASTPVTVRQLVLAMDEECAVAAEAGGIDATSIDEFDEWLLGDEIHLNQVFPEQRGVVAIVPRWTDVDYGNPWESNARNKDNHQTYFLIRNGERLYRYVTDFNAGARLVPTASEFTDFFYQRALFGNERTPIEPGSRQWKKAETTADARKRHYMRVGLILQGLVDRTAVFQPLPGTVRFLEADDYDEGRIVIVADGDMLLSDGLETFREWRRRLMKEIRPGMRVIGSFNTYESKDEWVIRPSRAGLPSSFVPHTITERVGDHALKFTYDRTDEIWGYQPDPENPGWSSFGSRVPKQRASCRFSDETDLILPFDLLKLEDVERFLRSRVERHRYVRMFPLLKAARRTLLEEIEQEAPFRSLLTGLLVRDHGVSFEDAEAAVPALVDWWKTTNRNHRPLVGSAEDNAKAVRLITDEYHRRLEDQRRPLNEKLVTTLRTAHPTALLIARRRDSTYVVLEPQDDGDTFVVETIYSARGVVKQRLEWQLVGTSPSRWTVAYQDEKFGAWNALADSRTVYTGPEITDVVERYVDERTNEGVVVVAVMLIDGTHGDSRQSTTIATVEMDVEDEELTTEYWADVKERALTAEYREVKIQSRAIRLRRDAEGHITWARTDWVRSYPTGIAWPIWEPSGPYTKGWRRVWLNEDAAGAANLMRERYHDVRRRASRLDRIVTALELSVAEQYVERAERRAFDAFVEEYRDASLWEGHRKSIRLQRFEPGRRDFGDVERALEYLVERGHVLDGVTVSEVADRARVLYGIEVNIPNELEDFIVKGAASEE